MDVTSDSGIPAGKKPRAVTFFGVIMLIYSVILLFTTILSFFTKGYAIPEVNTFSLVFCLLIGIASFCTSFLFLSRDKLGWLLGITLPAFYILILSYRLINAQAFDQAVLTITPATDEIALFFAVLWLFFLLFEKNNFYFKISDIRKEKKLYITTILMSLCILIGVSINILSLPQFNKPSTSANNWQLYTNTAFGFQFEIPFGWTIQPNLKISSPSPLVPNVNYLPVTYQILIQPPMQYHQNMIAAAHNTPRAITLGGAPGYEISFEHNTNSNENGQPSEFITVYKEHTYILLIPYGPITPIGRHILKTFKFTY